MSCQDLSEDEYTVINKVFEDTDVSDEASLADETAKFCLRVMKIGALGCRCPSGSDSWSDCDYYKDEDLDCSGTLYQAVRDAWLISMIVLGAAGLPRDACGGCVSECRTVTCVAKVLFSLCPSLIFF